jgi:hypothetical protein
MNEEIENPGVNILIGIPNQGTIKTKTMTCVVSLMTRGLNYNGKPINFALYMPEHTLFLHSRNSVVEVTKKECLNPFTHILWIDSDMTFTSEDFLQLLYSEKEIVCAPVIVRGREGTYDMNYNISLDKNGKNLTISELKNIKPPLFEIYYTGMAFMLCEVKVFRFFTSFELNRFKSEGALFCDYVRGNYRIYCNKLSKPGHIIEIVGK